MILSIVVILLVGVIAYFHFIQGFFSAGLSAILAAIAAILALNWTETVVHALLKGKFADQSYALILVALFGVIYTLLRVIFDKIVPGNVRFPVLLDKIGAAVMGLIAGIFAVGILIIAAQTLPFAAGIGMYERFSVEHDVNLTFFVPEKDQQQDGTFDRVDADKFRAGQSQGLLAPVDDLVLAVMSRVSADGGSLATGKPWEQVHPDFLQELFGQRAGFQISSRHTALPDSVEVLGVYSQPSFKVVDPELFEDQGKNYGIRNKKSDKLPALPHPGNVFLVVRIKFDRANVDEKSRALSLTPGAVRLAVQDHDGNFKNCFLAGESDDQKTLYYQQPDDYVFVPGDKGIDLVFEVPQSALEMDAKTKRPKAIRPRSILLEVKRMARVWLDDVNGGQIKSPVPPPAQGVELGLVKKAGGPPGEAAPSNPNTPSQGTESTPGNTNAGASPLSLGSPAVTNTLFTAISASQGNSGIDTWGTYTLSNNQFSSLEVEGGRSATVLANGGNPVNHFFVPEGKRMVQITAKPRGGDPWAWANDPAKFALSDAAGNKYPAQGFAAKVTTASGQNMLAIRYNANKGLSYSPPSSGDLQGSTPTDVVILFLVPSGTEIKQVEYNGQAVANAQLGVQ